MFDLGLPEIALIVVVALIFFGQKKIGALGKSLGSTFKAFKEGMRGDDEKKDKRP